MVTGVTVCLISPGLTFRPSAPTEHPACPREGRAIPTTALIRRLPVLAWCVALGLILLWPVTQGGYLLGHDMVFTPNQPVDAASFGLSSSSPRAVPLDALVAIAGHLIGGAAVARLALVLPLLAAGLGAAELLGDVALAGRLAAATVAIWNPYVIERLAIGQWALLWAYAALAWLLLAVRRDGAWALRASALAAASITPTGGLIAFAAAVIVGVRVLRRSGERWLLIALAAALQLTWLVPALVSPASATSDPAAVSVFSARSERPGGPLLSLLDGGGIWDADVVPASRGGALGWLWLALMVIGLVVGWRALRAGVGRPLWGSLLILSAAGLVLAVLPNLPGGAELVSQAVAHVPGAGLLRDAQKWIMPLVLIEALSVGALVAEVAGRIRPVAWRVTLAAAACAIPLLLLPDGPATLRPVLRPVHYPRDWAIVTAEARGADAVVLPFGSYRTFPWAPGRSLLDPAPRLLHVPTVVDDRLAVSGHVLRGEDPRAAAVAALLASGTPLSAGLARLHIGWVVVEHQTPGTVPDLGGLQRVHAGPDVSLYRVPGVFSTTGVSASRAAAVVVGDSLAVLAFLVPWGFAIRRRVAQRTPLL